MSPAWLQRRGPASADLVQTNGLGAPLASAMKRLMAACNSTIEVKTPRLSRCRVSLANHPSTALAQEHEVGVKWKVTRRWRGEPGFHPGVLVSGIVVEDHMDRLVGRDLALELGVEKADEFLMPVALHAAPDDLALEDIEGGKQGCGRPGAGYCAYNRGSSWRSAHFIGHPGWVRSRAWIWLFSSTPRTTA